jgi:hypothetical protein
MEASMPETMSELRIRAAREYKAARHATNELERSTHQSIANAYKALAESEAWLEGRIKPVGNRFVRIRNNESNERRAGGGTAAG